MKLSLIEWASVITLVLCFLQSAAYIQGRFEADQVRSRPIPDGFCRSTEVLTGFDREERPVCQPRLRQ